MHIEIHDKDGRVNVSDLTADGAREAIYQCEQLIEELRAQEESEDTEQPEGYSIGHDINGYYFVRPDEEDPDADGYAIGLDGREHFETEGDAWRAAGQDALASV